MSNVKITDDEITPAAAGVREDDRAVLGDVFVE
jgi:hypothetical protein